MERVDTSTTLHIFNITKHSFRPCRSPNKINVCENSIKATQQSTIYNESNVVKTQTQTEMFVRPPDITNQRQVVMKHNIQAYTMKNW